MAFPVSRKQHFFFAVILLCALTCLVLSPALKYHFLNWNDPLYVTQNLAVAKLDAAHVKDIFKQRIDGAYVPLTTLSFAIEHAFAGFDPFIYHLDNLLLHAMAVLLVFCLARQLNFSLSAAFIAALLFGIHPTRVEAVVWVSQRQELLYAVFYLGALWCYIRRYFGAAMTLGLLSLLASPMAVTLPLVLLLWDWYQGKSWNIKTILAKWPYAVMAIVLGSLSYAPEARLPFNDGFKALLIWPWTLFFYLQKFFVPLTSLPLYLLPQPVSVLNLHFAAALLLVILAGFMLWRLRHRRRLLFGFAFFFLSILIKLRFDQQPAGSMVADRFLYVPAFGLCLVAALGLERLSLFLKAQEKILHVLFLVGLAALGLGLGVLTYQQTLVWRDATSLWQQQIILAPNAMAYYRLAESYRTLPDAHQRAEQVISLYRKAIATSTDNNTAYRNELGDFYKESGDYGQAIETYQSSLKLDHKDKDALLNLGEVYAQTGKTVEAIGSYNELIKDYPDDEDVYVKAIEAYGQAIAMHPDDVVYQEKREEILAAFEQLSKRKKYNAVDYYNLAFLYQQVGGRDEAMRFYAQALRLQPNYAQALYNLANLYQESGDLKTALIIYERLVHFHPRFALGYLNMGIIFNALGDHPHARQLYLKVLALDADNSDALFNLGYLSESEGELRDAINYYEKAIEVNPKNAEAYYNLGNVNATLGQTGEAIAFYLKTVAINPKHQNAFVNLSILSFKSHDFQGAIRYLEQAQAAGYIAPAEYLRTLEPYRKR